MLEPAATRRGRIRLYYAPGACSLAPHIVLREVGADFEPVRVDLATHRTEQGESYASINPKLYVPALELGDGAVLTEGPAIVQFLADAHPSAGLAPPCGTLERARVQEWLNFLSAELHKAFGPLFLQDSGEPTKEAAKSQVRRRFDHIERSLSDGRQFLAGGDYGIADAYAFAICRWAEATGIGLRDWPGLAALLERIFRRPAVREALAAEGVLQPA